MSKQNHGFAKIKDFKVQHYVVVDISVEFFFGSCLRSCGIRPPELQEPLARLAGAVAVAAAIRAFVVPQISWVRCRRVARLTLALLAHKVGVRFY